MQHTTCMALRLSGQLQSLTRSLTFAGEDEGEEDGAKRLPLTALPMQDAARACAGAASGRVGLWSIAMIALSAVRACSSV
jgi:hypothetical protein